MRLGAPVRGVVYAVAALAAAATYTAGQRSPALGIAAMVIVGVIVEALNELGPPR